MGFRIARQPYFPHLSDSGSNQILAPSNELPWFITAHSASFAKAVKSIS
jgi:hypothetical protein